MRRLVLTAALAVLASPALAQEAPAAPAAPEAVAPETAPSAKSAEELAIEAEAAAFSAAMKAMQDELVKTTTPQEADAVVVKYQPQADALADRMSAFLLANADRPENAAEREELLTEAARGVRFVRELPAFIRSAVDQAVARGNAQAAAQAAAEAAEEAAPAAAEPAPAPASESAPAAPST